MRPQALLVVLLKKIYDILWGVDANEKKAYKVLWTKTENSRSLDDSSSIIADRVRVGTISRIYLQCTKKSGRSDMYDDGEDV